MNFDRFRSTTFPLLFAFSFSGTSVSADEIAEQEFIQLVTELDRFQASFDQTVMESDGYLLDESQGVMSFEKPNKLYWQINEPFPSTLVSDAETLYFYDPDLNQVTLRPWSADPSQNPLAVFVSDSQILDYYSIKKLATESGTEAFNTFVLTPNDLDASYTELQVLFKEQGISSMTVFDSIGQTTRIHFSLLPENALPEFPYVFQIPENAELIYDD